MQKVISIVIIVALLGLGAVIGYSFLELQQDEEYVACTLEAKICPDGSAVGREGPNCEFAACPSEN